MHHPAGTIPDFVDGNVERVIFSELITGRIGKSTLYRSFVRGIELIWLEFEQVNGKLQFFASRDVPLDSEIFWVLPMAPLLYLNASGIDLRFEERVVSATYHCQVQEQMVDEIRHMDSRNALAFFLHV